MSTSCTLWIAAICTSLWSCLWSCRNSSVPCCFKVELVDCAPASETWLLSMYSDVLVLHWRSKIAELRTPLHTWICELRMLSTYEPMTLTRGQARSRQ